MASGWIEVAKQDEVPEGGTFPVRVNGEAVCLYNLEGTLYATHDVCTHGQASLADGFMLEEGLIECPLHQGTFDIKTGKAVGAPCKVDIKIFEVKVENGAVFVKV
jgi:nitrite reductase/ring-hydroxylating ferredoxin subunit